MRRLAVGLLLGLAGCTPASPLVPTPVAVAARPDPDGFLYFNDAALYASAMTRCAARLPDYADEKLEADRVLAGASARYKEKGGNPDRADLRRLYAGSDRALAADLARQTPEQTAQGCVRLADYHRRAVAAYQGAG